MNYKQCGIPHVWTICSCCNGEGKVENPAFSNGFTGSEFVETFDDDQSREDYFAGAYDVACSECSGSGKVQAPDVANCTYQQKRDLVRIRKGEREAVQFAAECARVCRAESGYSMQ